MGCPRGHEAAPPRVWLLMGHRAGDNTQMLALADALGWPFEIKRFHYRRHELLTHLLPRPSLAGVARSRSSRLSPPWPDLVISAGRRNEPIGRWIQTCAKGRTRLVHLGRPWGRIERFDLVITTPQYTLPRRHNILEIEMPLHGLTPAILANAATVWRPRLAHLPRPHIAVLVGGNSPPYRLDAEMATRLGHEAGALANGGSLLVTTSARTSPEAAAALRGSIRGASCFHHWTPEATQNPYLGYLALADAIVVTGDSISMLAEACATDKPVYIFDVGRGRTALRPRSKPHSIRDDLRDIDATALLHRVMMRVIPARMRRDTRTMVRRLVASGRAAWLGDPPTLVKPQPVEGLQRAVARVRVLMDATAAANSEAGCAGRQAAGSSSTDVRN